MKNILGALKPKVDKRDYSLRAGAYQYPASYEWEEIAPVKNQKNVSSCVAHATSTILETFDKIENNRDTKLSTNFIYGMQGVVLERQDSGMYLRDACKIVKEYGDPLETTISGNTEQPACTLEIKNQLNDAVYAEAANYKIKSYATCKTANDIKHALINYGPVLASIKWYDDYSFTDKVIHFDKSSDYGYHAITIYGYNELGWLCQNSWGRNWNGDGKFIYPYDEKLCEAWLFVDAENTNELHIPYTTGWLNYIYKIINFIINLIKGNA